MQISENHMMSPFCACVLQQSAATLAGNRGLSEPASQLGSPGISGILAPRGRHVESGCQICTIGHLGWPAMVGIRSDLVEPSLDSRVLMSLLVPWIGVRLAVTLPACCSPRGWSRDGAENSKKGKIWQPGRHRKLDNSS